MKKVNKDRKTHNRSTWNSDKRREMLELVKRDVEIDKACKYCKIPVATFYDWVKRDKTLSEEYEHAKQFMDVVTSNTLTSAIMDRRASWSERAKRSIEWKKRRDKRYNDKGEIDHTGKIKNTVIYLPKKHEG